MVGQENLVLERAKGLQMFLSAIANSFNAIAEAYQDSTLAELADACSGMSVLACTEEHFSVIKATADRAVEIMEKAALVYGDNDAVQQIAALVSRIVKAVSDAKSSDEIASILIG